MLVFTSNQLVFTLIQFQFHLQAMRTLSAFASHNVPYSASCVELYIHASICTPVGSTSALYVGPKVSSSLNLLLAVHRVLFLFLPLEGIILFHFFGSTFSYSFGSGSGININFSP